MTRAGSVIAGRYAIEAELGHGGMGTVYRAHDRVLDETVALKVLRGDAAQAPEAVHRFRTEVKLARRVRHRNVCAIHDYGEDGGLLFIAMELVEGVDLRVLIHRQGTLPTEEAWSAALQIADGLAAIHEAGIMHRDLKTSNAMRDAAGVVRLMDFGIAKEWGKEGLTAVGRVVGTPEYMSPEQVRGAALDFRTDVYSLGILVFELFTGVLPFTGANPTDVVLKQLREEPPLDAGPGAALPPPLREVLRRALRKEREQRTPSVEQLRGELWQAWQRSAVAMPPELLAATFAPPAETPAPVEPAPPAPRARVVPSPHAPAPVTNGARAPDWEEEFEPAEPAVARWRKALSDPDPRRRFEAANALAELGEAARPALPELTRALRDEATFVRSAAALALKRLRGR
ncbi:MAG: protein kinase [Vicinamibacteria bacterium]|nr:protein kinase [Vicinamibacteria bacterium]